MCGLPAQVVDWGGWRDTGMAQRVGEQRQHQWSSRGLYLMSPEDALAAWQQVFRAPQVRTSIISVNWKEFLSGYPGGNIPGIYQDIAPGPVKDAPSPAQQTTVNPKRNRSHVTAIVHRSPMILNELTKSAVTTLPPLAAPL